jgi:hypothetical protein
VEFRRGGLVVQADRLSYDTPEDRAHGLGHVKISREGAVYSGPELMLNVQRFEGYFLAPTFEFLRMGTSGRADRIDFLGNARSRATQASYTSCPLGTGDEPDWQLRMRSVEMDFDANEGIAEGAVLRFLGTAHPGPAQPELSAQRRAQVGLVAAHHQPGQPQRPGTLGALLLEHRAQPRRHAGAAHHHAARAWGWTPSSATWSPTTAARCS